MEKIKIFFIILFLIIAQNNGKINAAPADKKLAFLIFLCLKYNMEKKIKILYLITQSGCGGAQKNALDLAAGLKNKYEILAAAGNEGGSWFFDALRDNGIPFIRLKHLQRAINPYSDLLALREIKNLLEAEQPDILHLHSSKASILGSVAGKLLVNGKKPKIIYTVHGAVFTAAFSAPARKIFLWLEKYAARLKNGIIYVSDYDKKLWLANNAAPAGKLTVVHNGLNAEKINFLSREKARKELAATGIKTGNLNAKIIGVVANLYPEKGLDYLIKAAKIIYKNNLTAAKTVFVVIGEGSERRKLEKMIAERNLQNIFFLAGGLKEAARYLKAFDVFVLPSIKEGFPYSLLEAMAAGLPIVATLVGGVNEIIDNNQNGFLVLAKNPKSLAESIAEILNNPAIAAKFSAANTEKIKEFSTKRMIEETEKIYLENILK